MRSMLMVLIVSVVILGGVTATPALEPKEKVKVEISKTGLHLGMDPGLYVCAASHLHITGTVQNVTKNTLVSVKLEGKAYDASDKLIGTAHPRKFKPLPLAPLKPGQKAEFDLEYRTITGPRIRTVKKQEIAVIEARP